MKLPIMGDGNYKSGSPEDLLTVETLPQVFFFFSC